MQVINRNGKLNLKNQGELEIFFLGTGTPFTTSLFNNNFIIIKGDTHLLVDFGFNAPIALDKLAGLEPKDINLFFPTHSHADHIGGVENLILSKRYKSGENLEILDTIITDEYKDILWNRSLAGGLEWNEYCQTNREMRFDSYFHQLKPKELTNKSRKTFLIKIGELELEIFETNHIPECAENSNEAFISYGLFVDKQLLISCDTKFDRHLIAEYKDRAKYIFHDCSLSPNPVHASYEELQTLHPDIKKKIYLMHYNDNWKDYDAKEFAGFARQGHSYLI